VGQIGRIFAYWAIFSFGQHFRKFRSSPKFWGYFAPRLKLYINLDKNVLGYIVGDLFPNSSDHPAAKVGLIRAQAQVLLQPDLFSKLFKPTKARATSSQYSGSIQP
jgi:hypothetical protein